MCFFSFLSDTTGHHSTHTVSESLNSFSQTVCCFSSLLHACCLFASNYYHVVKHMYASFHPSIISTTLLKELRVLLEPIYIYGEGREYIPDKSPDHNETDNLTFTVSSHLESLIGEHGRNSHTQGVHGTCTEMQL